MTPQQEAHSCRDAEAAAWATFADDLASWIGGLLVRSDVYCVYHETCERDRAAVKASTVWKELRSWRIVRHFRGTSVDDRICIPLCSPDETCRLVVIDLDNHSGDPAVAAANRALALHVLAEARRAGLDARLLDSDGRGGYHVWVLLDDEVSQDLAYRLGRWLIRDHARFPGAGLVESLPKSRKLSGKRRGSVIRLPGAHPKRPHWTRVWDPDGGTWLAGEAAIGSLLELNGNEVDLPALLGDFETARPARPEKRPFRADGDNDDLDEEVALARAALSHLGKVVNDYYPWLQIGMALSQLGEDGFELWDERSEQGYTYDEDMLQQKWESFRPGTAAQPYERLVTLGTLFKMAMDAGWDGPTEARWRRAGGGRGFTIRRVLARKPSQPCD